MLFDTTIAVEMIEPERLSLHDVVFMFPELNDKEFLKLTNSIRAQGQLDPVWINREGQIIDGRHRWKACKAIGVPVMCRRLNRAEVTTTIIEHVIAQNVARRHLESAQRAMIAAALEEKWQEALRRQELGVPPNGAGPDFPWETYEDLLAQMKTNKANVALARQIRKNAIPEFVRLVEDGALPLMSAYDAVTAGGGWLSETGQRQISNSPNPKKELKRRRDVKYPPFRYKEGSRAEMLKALLDSAESRMAGLPSEKISLEEAEEILHSILKARSAIEDAIIYLESLYPKLKKVMG